eukprot:GHVO01064093.1.p1 GENE.GHVO01064093.1~~GHVO01064093.1.p1  ORF type:complete len:107 (+),score=15.13 GHVO01064093.1:239-559(+)
MHDLKDLTLNGNIAEAKLSDLGCDTARPHAPQSKPTYKTAIPAGWLALTLSGYPPQQVGIGSVGIDGHAVEPYEVQPASSVWDYYTNDVSGVLNETHVSVSHVCVM